MQTSETDGPAAGLGGFSIDADNAFCFGRPMVEQGQTCMSCTFSSAKLMSLFTRPLAPCPEAHVAWAAYIRIGRF